MTNPNEAVIEKSTEEEKLSPLYYFYSVGCGFCKRVDPIVDELIKEGHDILKLDLSDKENQEVQKEVKEKYNLKCGTPWFVNADTGHQICGFREKDILLKWVNGEEIPEPPKPKSPPPKPPQNFDNKEQVDAWKTEYEKWKTENDHMPNLPTTDQMLQRLQQQKKMMEQRQQQQGGANPVLEARISMIEQKLDRLLKHLGVNTSDIKPPLPPMGAQQPQVQMQPPQQRSVPAPPASKKPPKKKRNKKK